MDIPYILNERMVGWYPSLLLTIQLSSYDRGTPVQECFMDINHPHVIRYIDADDEVSTYYVIAIEKQALLQSRACNQGGSRGSDEPHILTSFLLEPTICITT